MLALNFVAFSDGAAMLRAQSVAKTVAGVFPHALMFQSEPDNDFNDFIFLASSGAIDLKSKLLAADRVAETEVARDRTGARCTID